MLLVVILPVAVAAAISAWSSTPVPAATSDLASSQAETAANPVADESASAPVQPLAVAEPETVVNPLGPSTSLGRTSGMRAAVRVRTGAAPAASSRIAAPRVVAEPVDEDSEDGRSENSRRRERRDDDRDRDCLRRPSFAVWGPVSCVGNGSCRSGSWFSREAACGGPGSGYACPLGQRIAYGNPCGWPGSCGGRFSPGVGWPQRCFPARPVPIICGGLLPVRGGHGPSCSIIWLIPYPVPFPFPHQPFLLCQGRRCADTPDSSLRTVDLQGTSNPLTPDELTVEPARVVQDPAVPLPVDQQEPVTPVVPDPAQAVVAPVEPQPVVPVPGKLMPGTEPTLPPGGGAAGSLTPGDPVPVPGAALDPVTPPVPDLPAPVPVDPPNPPPPIPVRPQARTLFRIQLPRLRHTRPEPEPEPGISTEDENAVVEHEQPEDS